MNLLFFDTETTGLLDWKADITAPQQPNLVQLGAVLTDENLKERGRVDVIVLPEGEIPAKSVESHGITTEMAELYGVSRAAAVLLFDDLLCTADRIIAHNADYDVPVMKRAFWQVGHSAHGFDEVEVFCTKLATTPICRIRKANSRHAHDWKWPSLQEAHTYFYDKGFDNAHTAIVDVEACMRVYDGITRMGPDAMKRGLRPALTPRGTN